MRRGSVLQALVPGLLIALAASGCRERPAAPELTPSPSPSPPPTSTTDPWAALGAPALLEIPGIGVRAPLERLGLDADQRIDVPEAWENAGWYDAGFRPGEPGNALISGHYDTDTGAPAVFHRLRELRAGDEIAVAYPNGERFAFRVESKRLVDAESADRAAWEAVFGPADEPRLSLVTCDGVWDETIGTYDRRLILHARLVEGEGTLTR